MEFITLPSLKIFLLFFWMSSNRNASKILCTIGKWNAVLLCVYLKYICIYNEVLLDSADRFREKIKKLNCMKFGWAVTEWKSENRMQINYALKCLVIVGIITAWSGSISQFSVINLFINMYRSVQWQRSHRPNVFYYCIVSHIYLCKHLSNGNTWNSLVFYC